MRQKFFIFFFSLQILVLTVMSQIYNFLKIDSVDSDQIFIRKSQTKWIVHHLSKIVGT